MTRRFVFALLILFASGLPLRGGAQGAPTVVIVVRHAEKGSTPANDPPLTEAGVVRANALAAVLADANVQAVISTPLVRTKETARPTAESRGLTVETIALGSAAEQAKAVVAAVGRHAGQTVLVVGHSNTVGPIIAALGGPKIPDLCDSQYASLFTLVLDAKTVKLIRASYGAQTAEPPAGCPSQMR